MGSHSDARVRSGKPDLSAAESRIVQALRSKRHEAHRYWIDRGRRRFEAELAADGVDPTAAADLLDQIQRTLFEVSLDDVLRDIREREGQTRNVQISGCVSSGPEMEMGDSMHPEMGGTA